MPSAVRRALAFGPMPLIFLAASGQMRVGTSRASRITRPSGFSRSEAIFASSLFGAMPIEHESPVAALTAALIAHATRSIAARSKVPAGVDDAGSTTSVRSM